MKSMTGYGEASQNIHGARITVQIRSVNHRHLDLQVRTPREYMAFEEEIRKLLREKIARGRIDLFVNRYVAKGQARKLEMDEALIGQFLSGVAQLKKKYKLGGEVDVALVSNIPDVFHVRELEIDSKGERQAVLKALNGALKKLEQSREREGIHLRTDMEAQIGHLREIAAALEARSLETGARQYKGGWPDGQNGERPERNMPEVATAIAKGDINEELVRLKTHVVALAKVVREREPVGKKVDFMLQEVNRELNTITSKVPYLPVTQLVLQGKERVEKIREQTQNIE
ncbi:MAG TPA: YicC/YloC family endoribonuclease [Candidatus Limnocylindria bacterium]|nr:YicC/YloC family endoribonuclease [Candidatus Limnocylindria bacterium]